MSNTSRLSGTEERLRPRWMPKLFLSLGAFVVALAIGEVAFRLLGWPRFPGPKTESVRFAFAKTEEGGEPFYVNHPGRITFRYDDNPRGYFDQNNEVHHDVNPLGFRGPAFTLKSEGAWRLVCLGDSAVAPEAEPVGTGFKLCFSRGLPLSSFPWLLWMLPEACRDGQE